ncbi:MAG TPA: hypothetical protein IAC03_06285 [Candidatus Coprenecus pullistercoris]|nr:hypothetical protein [Candidatus Coprenecus pullistercoris]
MNWVGITSDMTMVDGRRLSVEERGERMLTALYREMIRPEYPKFFKMDLLSKLGFIASRLLVEAAGETPVYGDKGRPETLREDMALVICGCSGSLLTDRKFQSTIQDRSEFYPSPAVFVYTLPNIVNGEIAISNGWCGETSCFLSDCPDPRALAACMTEAFDDPVTSAVTGGWIDCRADDDFGALMLTVRRGETGTEVLAGWISEAAKTIGIIQ